MIKFEQIEQFEQFEQFVYFEQFVHMGYKYGIQIRFHFNNSQFKCF